MMIANMSKIESQICQKHNLNIPDFFEMCVRDDMNINEIAELAECSPRHLKRIARKYKFSFKEAASAPIPMLSESKIFKHSGLNKINIFSRRWVSASIQLQCS